MPQPERIRQLDQLFDFVLNAPENQEIIAMDCRDDCEQLSFLAERVAQGESLDQIMPELKEYMMYWGDCREEFLALVEVLKADLEGELPEVPFINEES